MKKPGDIKSIETDPRIRNPKTQKDDPGVNHPKRNDPPSKKNPPALVPDNVPPFTTSVDASVPGENIIAVYFDDASKRWTALNRSDDGSVQIGTGNTEPLARRVAGLKAIERAKGRSTVPASDRFISLDHNSAQFHELISKIDELIDAVRENNEYAMADPDDRSRRLSELASVKELLKHPSAAAVAFAASALTFLSVKFADGLIGNLADTAFKILEKLLGG